MIYDANVKATYPSSVGSRGFLDMINTTGMLPPRKTQSTLQ